MARVPAHAGQWSRLTASGMLCTVLHSDGEPGLPGYRFGSRMLQVRILPSRLRAGGSSTVERRKTPGVFMPAVVTTEWGKAV